MARKIALPTLHKKGDQIIPAFQELTDFEIVEVEIDTDSFGTFSGEIERTLSPRDAALAKAEAALSVTGWDGAIASEGSIGTDPRLPFLISDREVMVFVDRLEGVVIEENHLSFEIIAAKTEYRASDDLSDFLRQADFPNHHLIVTSRSDGSLRAIKGISDEGSLRLALEESLRRSDDGKVMIESDLRAHASPSRQANIAHLARLLAKRISKRCPSCDAPGWGRVDHLFGVECEDCGHLDERIASQVIEGCGRCDHRAQGEILRERIKASECELCNP